MLSEVERALKELGVRVIHADFSQAKGRIERLFRTFRDRLVKEMRLKCISSMEETNRFLESYLPIYNERSRMMPAGEADFHRAVPFRHSFNQNERGQANGKSQALTTAK